MDKEKEVEMAESTFHKPEQMPDHPQQQQQEGLPHNGCTSHPLIPNAELMLVYYNSGITSGTSGNHSCLCQESIASLGHPSSANQHLRDMFLDQSEGPQNTHKPSIHT